MRYLLLFLSILIISACSSSAPTNKAVVSHQEPIPEYKKTAGYFKVGSSYNIRGIRYTPRERYSFTQTGTASWYGPNFHGKLTANGEIFDKHEMTAAHRTLQMPSIARVTNLSNGKEIIVRINDRGPFSKGRVLDLSERAAEALDFKHKGTAQVRIDVLEGPSREVARMAKSGKTTRGFELTPNKRAAAPKPPRINAKTSSGTYVQVGSFGHHGNALSYARKLQGYGHPSISPIVVDGATLYRVRFGPFNDQIEANQMIASLANTNISEPIVITE